MNYQITLEELGLIPKQVGQVDRSIYATSCGGCICEHCSNNVDCTDKCVGEANFSCFNCDDCYNYSGKGIDNWKSDCKDYKVTNHHVSYNRKRLKRVK